MEQSGPRTAQAQPPVVKSQLAVHERFNDTMPAYNHFRSTYSYEFADPDEKRRMYLNLGSTAKSEAAKAPAAHASPSPPPAASPSGSPAPAPAPDRHASAAPAPPVYKYNPFQTMYRTTFVDHNKSGYR
eukprot:tig00020553_g10579.t1